MSQENIEVVRQANRLFNAGDVDSTVTLFHPSVEWRDLQHAPDTPEFVRGRDAIRALWTAWVEAFDDLNAEVLDFTDADPWVLCDTQWRGRGKGSGLAIDVRSVDAYEFNDGAIVRIVVGYPDRAMALRAIVEEAEWAVSQKRIDENVRFVLASYEWSNRERKFARDWWHDDGEWINAREDPDHAIHRGTRAIEKLFASWIEAYPDVRVDPVEAQANGNRVFVWVRFSGQGAVSGLSLGMELAHVVTLEDDRIRRLQEYSDRTEALKAVGLE